MTLIDDLIALSFSFFTLCLKTLSEQSLLTEAIDKDNNRVKADQLVTGFD